MLIGFLSDAERDSRLTGPHTGNGLPRLPALPESAATGLLLSKLQPLQQICHRGIKPAGDHLQRDNPGFPLATLDIRDVTTVHVQVHGHVSLSPSPLLA